MKHKETDTCNLPLRGRAGPAKAMGAKVGSSVMLSPAPGTPPPTGGRPRPEFHFGRFPCLYFLCLPNMNVPLNNTGLDLLPSFIKNASWMVPLLAFQIQCRVSQARPAEARAGCTPSHARGVCTVRTPRPFCPLSCWGPAGGRLKRAVAAFVCVPPGAHVRESL